LKSIKVDGGNYEDEIDTSCFTTKASRTTFATYVVIPEIEMFAMHPLPPTTQRTYHHLYEVNTSAIREISNRHFILFYAKRWTRVDDVNMSMPWWRNFNRWQNNSLQSSSSLPPICLLH
jgi:hypothetical protein